MTRIGLIAILLALSGCAGGPARQVMETDRIVPTDSRSLIVFGLAALSGYRLGVQTYLVDKGTFEVCESETVARVQTGDWPEVRYFVFSVPPGHYAFRGSRVSQELARSAFVVPKSQLIYLGDFIQHGERDQQGLLHGRTERRDNLEQARSAIAGFPHLPRDLQPAEIIQVEASPWTKLEAVCPLPWIATPIFAPLMLLGYGLHSVVD